MRYYRIEITDPANPNASQVYTSHYNGLMDPGALNVIFDVYVVPFATPRGASVVEIFGIPIQSISQATNLNNKNVVVSAGFKKGLPLANAAQAGVIIQGYIVQSFGNWQGTDMTLSLVVVGGSSPVPGSDSPPTGSYSTPLNGSFVWNAGQPLCTALSNFFSSALPDYTSRVSIDTSIASSYQQTGVYRTLESFATQIKEYSKSLLGGLYPGVNIRLDPGNVVTAYDGTPPAPPTSALQSSNIAATDVINISFYELVGQPVFVDPNTIQVKVVMRSDVKCGDSIVLPTGFFGVQPSTPSAPWNYRDKSAQAGVFEVTEVRHVGNFRQPDGNSWVTVLTAVTQ